MPYSRGRRVLQCHHCQVDYLPAVKSNRHNGSGVPLCDDCYLVVKHCNRCDRTLPVEDFSKTKQKACGRSAFCRSCNSDTWRATPQDRKFSNRARSKKFDITHDEYLAMREAQNNLCAICGLPETDAIRGQVINLAIDHCHRTGEIRALLCGRCNKAIGLMLDDPERLRAAADYLEKWAATLAIR
ncbi:MAG: endonuclease VII domain-containing protein [Actinomycetota bacterium]